MSFVDDPFPGMNPFLEDYWRDVHASLVVYLRNALQPHLPEGLVARVEESLSVEADPSDGWPQNFRADVLVAEERSDHSTAHMMGGVAVAEAVD